MSTFTIDSPPSKPRKRSIEEILNRPRLVEAITNDTRQRTGEYIPHQGLKKDVDKEIFALEGVDYNQHTEIKSKITTLEIQLVTLKEINQIFNIDTTNKIQEIEKEIHDLKNPL